MEVQTDTKITKSTSRKKRRDNSLYTQTIINFPDGQSVSINDPAPRLISMNELLA